MSKVERLQPSPKTAENPAQFVPEGDGYKFVNAGDFVSRPVLTSAEEAHLKNVIRLIEEHKS